MDNLIEAIRAALAEGATDEAKQTGASACRAILTALDAQPGQPLAPAPANSNVFAALGKMDLNQLLDVVIARLRVMNAAHANDNAAPSTLARPVAFPIVRVPSRHGG